METRANYVVIGLFSLAVLAAGLSFIYWVVEFGSTDETAEIIFQFNGPVDGLNQGSPVRFNGIRIGEVRSLALDANNPEHVLAHAVVDANAPVRADTEATLAITGITGTAFIALRGGSLDEPALLDPAREVVIEAEISAVQDLIDGARNVLGRVDDAMDTIDNFLLVNEPYLTQTIIDINEVTSTIAAQSGNIELLMEGVGSIANEISGLSGRLENIISGSENLIASVDPESVAEVVENVRVASGEFRGIGEDARALIARGDVVFDNLEASSQTLVATLDDVQAVVGAVDPQSVSEVVENVRVLVERGDTVFDNLETSSQGLVETIDGARAIVASVNPESVDEVVENVRVASAEFRGIGEEARALVARGDAVFDNLETSSQSLVSTLDGVEAVVGAIDPTLVAQAVDDVATFASVLPATGDQVGAVLAEAQTATENVTRFTESLSDNAEQVDAIFADAVIIADRLEIASQRIDGILAGVDGLLTDEGTGGLIADASAAARAIRNVAVSFEGRSETIAAGLARFSGRGLQDVEALVGDGRRLLARLERVVSSLERNPQQLIFGEGATPEYSPQRR